MPIDERIWKITQRHLGYDESEMTIFKNNQRNEDLLSRSSLLKGIKIVLEVVESKGCNSNHKVGDKFYFDAVGNLLTELCPKKICGYSLSNAMMMVFTANEMLYAGIDPNQIRFKRASCFDVGLECGGWGRVVLELRVENQDHQIK